METRVRSRSLALGRFRACAARRWPASYHLAVVVDDAMQGVSDVVRGRDLYHATSVHRLLQELLGLAAPRYRHHRLVRDASGAKMSKSASSTPLAGIAPNMAFAAEEIRAALGFGGASAERPEGRDQLTFCCVGVALGAWASNPSMRSRSRLKAASILPSNSRVRASLIAIGSTKRPLTITS